MPTSNTDPPAIASASAHTNADRRLHVLAIDLDLHSVTLGVGVNDLDRRTGLGTSTIAQP
jgi:hypothetical protein